MAKQDFINNCYWSSPSKPRIRISSLFEEAEHGILTYKHFGLGTHNMSEIPKRLLPMITWRETHSTKTGKLNDFEKDIHNRGSRRQLSKHPMHMETKYGKQ